MTVAHDALILDEHLTLSLGERVAAEPRPGEALLKLEWAGVCGSDLHVLRTGDWVTDWPATLGHEVVGVVVSCPGDELAEGSLVVVDSRMPCDRCDGCRRAANQCEAMRWVGEAMPGGFQRLAVFGTHQLVPCPEGLEGAIAVLAEPLAVAMHAVSRAGAVPERALVLGYGPVGALVHTELVRRRPDVEVTVIEPLPERAQLARAAGASVAPPGTAGRWPLVVDAAGYSTSLPDAIALAGNGGTVLMVALAHSEATVLPQEITERGLTIVGANGFDRELPEAIASLSANPDAYRWLITESVLLEEAADRLGGLLSNPSAGKVVIRL